MTEQTIFSAGVKTKSDLFVTLDISSETLDIEIKSGVMSLFGRQIEESVKSFLSKHNITKGKFRIEDNGALNYVIDARLEAVLRKSGWIDDSLKKDVTRAETQKDRLRRSRLYLPGNNPDLAVNSGLFGADSYILDLEDSVAPDQKFDARILVRKTLEEGGQFFKNSEIIVRINPLNSPYGLDDLKEIVPARPHLLLLPKCNSADDVEKAEQIVESIEKAFGIKDKVLFMPLVETVKGVVNAASVAASSERNVAMCFGAEDFTRDMGVPRTRDGKETIHARTQTVFGAKSANIQAIDTVFSDIADEEGLRNSCIEAKAIGFCGKGVIHPRQIKIVHDAFAPDLKEVDEAKRIVDASREAKEKGSGVISLGSKMIDAPVAARAQKLIELAKKMNFSGLEDY